MASSIQSFFRTFRFIRWVACLAILSNAAAARADTTCAPGVQVSTPQELNAAVANGDTCILVEPGLYLLTEQLLLKNVTLLGMSGGDVTFDVGNIPPNHNVPFLGCHGEITGVPFFGNTALIVSGDTTIENIHFTGLKIDLDGYINNTNQACEGGLLQNRYRIQNCTFEAKNALGQDCTLDDLSLCPSYSVSLGNTNTCGSCDAHAEVLFANNTMSGTIFGLFIVNEVSDEGATVEATIKDNTLSAPLVAFLVVGSAAGKGGIINGSSEGNTFRDAVVGAFFGGGSDYFAGIGSQEGRVSWTSSGDKFTDNFYGFNVVGARRHVDPPEPLPPVQPSTGNRVEISFFGPEFQGNFLHDGQFFGSASQQPRKTFSNPIGVPANQINQGSWGPGNEVHLRTFKDPVFHDGVGRLIFRHHNSDFCVFNGCFPNPNFLTKPPHVPGFGNRVHIDGSRQDFVNAIPLEEKPSADFFR